MAHNEAVVARLSNIRPIAGADKIVEADVTVQGIKVTSVVVGVDSVEGQKVVYFDSNMCVGDQVLKDYPELDRYLGKRGRVKTVKLRGTYSDGLAVEVEKFNKYDPHFQDKEEGYSLTEIGDAHICHRYVPPQPKQPQSGNKERKGKKKDSRIIPELFHFHIDTEQLARNVHEINPDDVISISRKIHGTSCIVSHIPVKRKLSLLEKILKLFVRVQDTEYDYVFASRRVIKNGTSSGYYSTDIWTEVGETFRGKLLKGETVYLEIVGYQSNGQWIQKDYDYGCIPRQYRTAVYRMTWTDYDGNVVDYGWQQMIDRCEEMGVEPVETFFHGRAGEMVSEDVSDWHEAFLEKLRVTYIGGYVPENKVKKVPEEGIVVKKEGAKPHSFKLKSMEFLKKETDMFEKGEVDTEENA
jgi:hypothetical protein